MKLFILLFFLFSCSNENTTIPLIDSGLPDTYTGIPACNPNNVAYDFYHCGSCDNRCPSDDADRCTEGICTCGLTERCYVGADCRLGRCIDRDPTGIPCEFDSWCHAGEACIEGNCSFVSCVPEVCDGVDNDCDGIIDNNGPVPLAEYCGPTARPVLPPCRLGVRSCDIGTWTECVGAILPSTEMGLLGCDGTDNDCDGCTDGTLTSGICISAEPTEFDIVFGIDVSGSMASSIADVTAAVRSFSSGLTSPVFRFAIVKFGLTHGFLPVVHSDLQILADFELSLDSITDTPGGSEASRDTVYLLGMEDAILSISWRPGSARIIIILTDERAQSYLMPSIVESVMCDSLTRGETLAVVTKLEFFDDWRMCARLINMDSSVTELAHQLSMIIGNPCD